MLFILFCSTWIQVPILTCKKFNKQVNAFDFNYKVNYKITKSTVAKRVLEIELYSLKKRSFPKFILFWSTFKQKWNMFFLHSIEVLPDSGLFYGWKCREFLLKIFVKLLEIVVQLNIWVKNKIRLKIPSKDLTWCSLVKSLF